MICFFVAKNERILSRDLVRWLNSRGDRPWAEARKGKEITEVWLSRQLRPYGVAPKTLWIGEESARGYERVEFDELFQRYIPKAQARKMIEELKAGLPRKQVEVESCGLSDQEVNQETRVCATTEIEIPKIPCEAPRRQ